MILQESQDQISTPFSRRSRMTVSRQKTTCIAVLKFPKFIPMKGNVSLNTSLSQRPRLVESMNNVEPMEQLSKDSCVLQVK